MADLYSRPDIIEALREFFKAKGLTLSEYDPAFDPARIPIFAYKKEKADHGIFVDIITEESIQTKDYFRDKRFSRSINPLTIKNASSAQFFRHYLPNSLIYWVIPDYIKKDQGFEGFVNHCREAGIGLYEVYGKDGKLNVREMDTVAKPLLEQRVDKLIGLIEEGAGRISSVQKERIGKLLDYFSDDDLAYLVFYPEPKYLAPDICVRDEDRNISKELINRVGNLRYVNYKSVLSTFSKTYYNETLDDYKLALKITEKLWNRYGLEYPKLHRDFEEVLKLDPRYRDHFLHAFQVFLYGAYVLDVLYDRVGRKHFGTKLGDRIEDAWAIGATYHDYNYMIQNFDSWTKRFFIRALHLEDTDENPASLELSVPYVRRGYMLNTKRLADILDIEVNHEILNFLYDQILQIKNHGLISGLSLLKYVEKNPNKLSTRVRDSACKAVALHDLDFFSKLLKVAENCKGRRVRGNKSLKTGSSFKNIEFEKDPVSFLLLVADSIQEQGREEVMTNRAELDKLSFEDNKIYTDISFEGVNAKEKFEKKIGEIKDLRKCVSSGGTFVIGITARVDGEEREDHYKEYKI